MEALQAAGLADVRVTAHFDCFAGTSKERTARRYDVFGANVAGRKPA